MNSRPRSLSFWGLAWTAVIPAAYLISPARSSSDARNRPVAVADASSDSLGAPQTAMMLIEKYVGRPLDSVPRERRPRVGVMIVDVPDPFDAPNLDWRYDAGITSIRRASEASGFVIDRFWLPWMSAADRKRYKTTERDRRRSKPGVMVFQSIDSRGGRADQLEVVFVVSETPNAGVNKPALTDAMAQIDSLRRQGLVVADTLRMVAPYFTGAAHSLRLALEAHRPPQGMKVVRMVTGSATQGSIRNELTTIPGVPVDFYATINSDAELQTVLFDVVLNRLKFHRSEVAVLQETSTEYGSKVVGRSAGAISRIEPETERMSVDTTLAQGVTIIPFPMHIASLRNQQDTAEVEATPSLGASRSPFPISLREPGQNVDRPPSLSALTPAGVSLAVEQIAHTLGAGRYRAVGIIATDIRDKLFLAREVRLRLPDVQLFTTESNLLYLWPEYSDALRGMLVATTYPLDLEVQSWVQESWREKLPSQDRQLLAFTEEAAEGIYNAILMQRGATANQLVDFDVPSHLSALHRPPIWLFGVGRNALIPLYAALPGSTNPFVAGVSDDGKPIRPDAADKVVQAGAPVSPPLPATSQPGRTATPAAEDSREKKFVIWLLLFAAVPLIAGRIVELSRTRDEYVVLDAPPKAQGRDDFSRIRRLVFSRSLLIHQQLYTMLRDLTLGAGIAVIATVLLKTEQTRTGLPLSDLAGLKVVLELAVVVIVAFSAKWAAKVTWQMFDFGKEYAIRRDWFTERRRGEDQRAGRAGMLPPKLPDRREGERRQAGPGIARFRQVLWNVEILLRIGVVVVALVFSVLIVQLVTTATTPDQAPYRDLAAQLFFFRSAHLASGLSPILPIMVIVMGFAAWTTWHLSRIDLLKNPVALHSFADTRTDGHSGDLSLGDRLAKCINQTRERLFLVVPDGKGLVILLVLFLSGVALYLEFNRTLESISLGPALAHRNLFETALGWLFKWLFRDRNAFDLLLALGVLSALGSLAWGVYRLWTVWGSLKHFLNDLSASPLLPAFERIPERVSHLSQLTLRQEGTREAVRGVTATQWHHLMAIQSAAQTDLDALPFRAARAIQDFKSYHFVNTRPELPFDTGADQRFAAIVREIRQEDDERIASTNSPVKRWLIRQFGFGGTPDLSNWRQRRREIDQRQDNREEEVGTRLRKLFAAVQECWHCEPQHPQVPKAIESIAARSSSESEGSTSGNLRRLITDPARLWLRTAEEVLAVQIVAYIEWVLEHLRALALFLLIGLLLVTLLLSSYPFQPQSGIKMLFVCLLLVTVASVLTVGTQMNRDEVISRVTRSDPGKITWSAGYVLNILMFGLLPILTYVGSGVQPIREGLLQWFEPLARVLSQH